MESASVSDIASHKFRRHSKYGRRNRKRQKRQLKQRPVICGGDRELIELRQWMKITAGFRCSLVPATFPGNVLGLGLAKGYLQRPRLACISVK